jgi:glutathione peroxidase
MIGRQLFNLAYLIHILKTKNSEHFKRKIVFNKANKLYYDSLFKGLFNILDTEKFKSIHFESIDIDSLDNADIVNFCKKNYGVNFPLMEKSIVIKKNHQNEVHKWLSDMTINGWCHQEPAWNFCKYLVNEEGVLTHYFPMTVDPLSSDMIAAIEGK